MARCSALPISVPCHASDIRPSVRSLHLLVPLLVGCPLCRASPALQWGTGIAYAIPVPRIHEGGQMVVCQVGPISAVRCLLPLLACRFSPSPAFRRGTPWRLRAPAPPLPRDTPVPLFCGNAVLLRHPPCKTAGYLLRYPAVGRMEFVEKRTGILPDTCSISILSHRDSCLTPPLFCKCFQRLSMQLIDPLNPIAHIDCYLLP